MLCALLESRFFRRVCPLASGTSYRWLCLAGVGDAGLDSAGLLECASHLSTGRSFRQGGSGEGPMVRKAPKSSVIAPEPHAAGSSATRIRTHAEGDLRDPRNRAALALECWKHTGEEYWLRCAWSDAEKGLSWDDLCLSALGIIVDPPEPEETRDAAPTRVRLRQPGGCSPRAGLLGAPVAMGQDVVLTIEVERNGKCEVFVVTARAPTLFGYVPYVEEVRAAIAEVVAMHEGELRIMFARMD